MNTENIFRKAVADSKLCVLKDRQGHERLVQPYGIFKSSKNMKMFCCYQISGYSESGDMPNWRNVPTNEMESVEIKNISFSARQDYNPFNKSVYAHWLFKMEK